MRPLAEDLGGGCMEGLSSSRTICFALWVHHYGSGHYNKGSLSVWHVTREHVTREQPIDAGPEEL